MLIISLHIGTIPDICRAKPKSTEPKAQHLNAFHPKLAIS